MLLPAQLAAIDKADAVCRNDPIQNAVRSELLRLHHAGTSSPVDPYDLRETSLYLLAVNPDTLEASSAPLTVVTRLVRHYCLDMKVDVVTSLNTISFYMANPELGVAQSGIEQTIAKALNEWTPCDGFQVYGYGVVSAAWSVRDDKPGIDEFVDAVQRGEDATHDDMVPLWYTHLVGRDHRVWTLLQQTGYDLVYATDGPDEAGSDAPEVVALMRFLEAGTSGVDTPR